MKQIIKQSLKKVLSDRYLLVLLIILIVLALIASIVIGFSIHSSERQLVSHYSAFGETQFYMDQWSYLLVFVGFELIVAILHIAMAIKLFIIKGHTIAVMFAWFGIGIVILGWVTTSAILNLRALL